ncbi:MAG: ComEC/Rec2 family competence protein, partial [Candidatus Limnocylindrales bacterium]
ALATAGLIAWSGPLTSRLRAIRGGALPGWLAESLAISIAAEVATLPVVLLTFGRLAVIAPLANLVIVPLVPPAMAAGALALGSGWFAAVGLPPAIVTILGLPAWALLGLMVGLVRLAAGLPFASVTLAPPFNVVAAGIAAAVAAFAMSGSRLGRTVRVGQGGPA